jgi:hypothetical protein
MAEDDMATQYESSTLSPNQPSTVTEQLSTDVSDAEKQTKTNEETVDEVGSIEKNGVGDVEPAEEPLQRKITGVRWIFVMAAILSSVFLFALGMSHASIPQRAQF